MQVKMKNGTVTISCNYTMSFCLTSIRLARAKKQLSEQNQECGRLQGENLEMEQDIADLKYSHQ